MKMKQSVENKIVEKIKNHRRGNIFFADDFALLGSADSIRQALQNLQKSGLLVRVATGVYAYPKLNKFEWLDDKYILPTIDEIARAIAKRDKIRIVPTGLYALNALGLSTQVVMNVVYITDGAARQIQVGGGRGILFKHTSEIRRLSFKSELLMLIDSALREIGEKKVQEHELEIIKEKLKYATLKDIDRDIDLMPIWIREIVLKLWKY
ncbi:MAG: type IV toxin-antitoxin system AbiEi family antitoxin domain-containing protein [Bacteroidales bacterium]|jgi:predicted transcriptional regulator of viral defense system|nr:type IV toxin-antitoxin system AbiEi family antitoxin domain-containing protein [Bacteroidales bacterium]